MDRTVSSAVTSVLLIAFLCQGIQADTEAQCRQKCIGRVRTFLQFTFSNSYIHGIYRSCMSNCVSPQTGGFAFINYGTTTTTTPKPVIPTRRTTQQPFVWNTRPATRAPPPVRRRTPRPPTPRPTPPPRPRTPAPTPPPTRLPQTDCGYKRRFTSRIIGGQGSEECEFPWMVAVRVPSDFCGGFIIDKRHIVTAAHCLKDLFDYHLYEARQIKVRVGSSRQTQLRTLKAKRLYVHPSHNSLSRDYDVAVIVLEEDLVFGPCLGAVCLPKADQMAEHMDECVVAGWGLVIPNDPRKYQPDILQKVTIPVIDNSICQKQYGYPYYNDKKICAGYYGIGGRDSCNGDSGGPLMCRNKNGPYSAFGIVSFGNDCANPAYPGVYTRVNHPSIMEYIIKAIYDS